MREEILLKIREIEALLAQATCNGEPIEEGDPVHGEVMQAVWTLEEHVDEYID